MNRVAIWIANGALLIVGCFLTARIVTAIAAEALAPPPVALERQTAPVPRPQGSWESRQAILKRNLFDVSTFAPPPPPPPKEDPDEVYQKTRLPLRLLGTAAAPDPAMSLAAVEDLDNRDHLVVRAGDELKGTAEVVRIEPRRIVLRNAGKLEELSLEEDDQKPNQRNARSRRNNRNRARANATRRQNRENTRDRVRRLMENRFQVNREDVEAVARNPAELMNQARILPKYQDGQMQGLQLNAIKPGSIFEEIGIKNGDVITEFNGIQVTNPQESHKLLGEFGKAEEFKVTVMGQDGTPRQLFYEVK